MSELNDAIAQMIVLATRLRTHSERLKDTHIKGMADELLVQLAELQINFEAFASEHAALKGQVQNPGGERCPRCGEIGWKLTSTRQDKAGRTVRTFSCKSCKLKEEVVA